MRSPALVVLGCLLTWSADAREVRVPMPLDFAFMRELLIRRAFTDADGTARVFTDDSGCTHVTLLHPEVGAANAALLVTSEVDASFGTLMFGLCLFSAAWQGRIEAKLEPSLDPLLPFVHFRVADSRLLERDGSPAGPAGALWSWVKSYVHPRLELVAIDLAQPTRDLRAVLPLFLSADDAARGSALVDSLALEAVVVGETGVNVTLLLDPPLAEPAPRSDGVEAELSADEVARLEASLARWDGFVTFVVKRAGAAASDPGVREHLLEVLLDARYRVIALLEAPASAGPDPVRPLFVSTWQRLATLLRALGASWPEGEALRWLGFIAAADALAALDALGPEMGIEISANGLRRLARIIAPDHTGDPLATPEKIDPELRRTFGFGAPLPEPEPEPTPPSSSLVPRRLLLALDPARWLVGIANAAALSAERPGATGRTTPARLNRWVPTRAELPVYLPTVRTLLRKTSVQAAHAKSLAPAYRSLYGDLQLATAWQESCWRQYVRIQGLIRPLRSRAGAVGLMQVNSRAWRGFYDARSLESDIAYNSRAGSEILLHYLVDLALARGEHRRPGGALNLVRATYAAYNGGPSHLQRYRRAKTPKSLRAIDASLIDKYKAVRAGRELEVARCFG